MYKLTCIIIEDEPLARQVITGYVSRIPFLELRGSFEDALDALACLKSEKIDLMFLDIHLPGIHGLNFLKSLLTPPAVIITTAYHEYALTGYELNVVDYLLKPFEFDRFVAAVNKVRQPALQDYFFINVQLKKVKVYFSDILYVESQKEYVKIVTENGVHVTKLSTHEIEERLPAGRFKRIHRSFIISIDKILSFNSEFVELKGKAIPIGRAYRDGFTLS